MTCIKNLSRIFGIVRSTVIPNFISKKTIREDYFFITSGSNLYTFLAKKYFSICCYLYGILSN